MYNAANMLITKRIYETSVISKYLLFLFISIQLLSDVLFNYNLLESIERNEHNNTFMYQMNYQGSNSVVHYLGMKGRYGMFLFQLY
jgi:hypothetical protein